MSSSMPVYVPPPTFASFAKTGDWRAATRLAITTGIVVTQASSWDRLFGAILSTLFGDASLLSWTIQATSTTLLGVGVIFAMHRLI